MPESIPQACNGCGATMGRLVLVDDKIYLDVGNFLVSSGRKTCHVCGRTYHFQRPKRPWRSLLQQAAVVGVGG